MSFSRRLRAAFVIVGALAHAAWAADEDLVRLQYNHPGLIVDLAVGLWAQPLPMDFDGDGDCDLVVSCPDKPYNGLYLFENPGGKDPVFKPARRLSHTIQNLRVSHVEGRPRVLGPGQEFLDFRQSLLARPSRITLTETVYKPKGLQRANQWHSVDYDGDGALDLIVGVDDWGDYGWDQGYDALGRWLRGPLLGRVFWLRNEGNKDRPRYVKPRAIEADGKLLAVYGWPSPCVADFDGDGDLDLVCGEFRDSFTYFANVGTRKEPRYAAGRRLSYDGRPLTMDLCMIVPTPIDWDRDGDVDLVVGDEDGRVALVEHSGKTVDGMPQFLPPRYFRQQADVLKCGALATPVGYDWDSDGDDDLVCGNTAGQVVFFENLGGTPPRWAAPRKVSAGGAPIQIQAGPNGSIQGPAEAKWGYSVLSIADWDGDGLADVVLNSIWGRVVWYRNVGKRGKPELAAALPVEVLWHGQPPKPAWTWWQPRDKELVTQWRTTPVAVDFDGDRLVDLVMLDHEGFLAIYRRALREGRLVLLPPERVFIDKQGEPIRLNARKNGKSGRRKLCVVDWDRDGRLDLLVDGRNANFWRNTGSRDGKTILEDQGPLAKRNVAAHDTQPAVVDWNRDGRPELVVGAEDGHFYYLR